VEAVESWLEFHEINPKTSDRTGSSDWITLRVTVAQAERMLGTKYNVYHHPASSQRVVRTMSYSLPRELHSHIDLVAPTTYFGTLRSMRTTSFLQPDIKPIEEAAPAPDFSINAVVPASCGTTITPACLRALYNTSTYTPTATATNKLGVAGYLEEFANRADLQVSCLLLCGRFCALTPIITP
jgi:tripeptidyl-peptidase-1